MEEYRGLIDTLYESYGGSYESLKRIFRIATRYEYMFWSMAYNMERWPV